VNTRLANNAEEHVVQTNEVEHEMCATQEPSNRLEVVSAVATSAKDDVTSRDDASDFGSWVRATAAAQGLPPQIEDPAIYAQLAEIVTAGRQSRTASRTTFRTEHAS
jgi:hypothetical protein